MSELEAVPTEARRVIERKLADIESGEDVRILFAVESGIRG